MIEKFNKANENVNNGSADATSRPKPNRGIVVEDSEQPQNQPKSGCC
jgi:hypothetical protein